MARPNQTAFRFSDEVKKIVDDAPGESFADRFEYICTYYSNTKHKKQQELQDLDKSIEKRKKELQDLSSKLYSASQALNEVDRIKSALQNLSRNDVIQICAASPAPRKEVV